MATLGAMADEVIERMGQGRTTNTRLRNKVVRQIKRNFKTLCARRDWSWKNGFTTLSATSTDTYITLPTVSYGGRTVPVIHRIRFIMLQSTGRVLHYRPELLDLIARGTTLALEGRGEPTAWCVGVDDTTGTQKLLLMPLLGYNETLQVWFTRSAASMALLLESDSPPYDEEYEGYLIEKTVAQMAAADQTVGEGVFQMAQAEANLLWRAMCHTEAKASPPVQAAPKWLGHGEFSG